MNVLQTISLKKAVLALALVALVATAGFLSTRAFFSDTETSAANVFSAGSMDLLVGINAPGSDFPVVAPRANNNQQLFAIDDLMPGQVGTGELRMISEGGDAWACMSAEITDNLENTRLSQEQTAGDTTPGDHSGELKNYMEVAIWEANGLSNSDGVVGTGEKETLQVMSLEEFANGDSLTLQDSSANGGDNPLVAGAEYRHEFAYCFGEFSNVTDVTNNGGTLECNGATASNVAQTDGVELALEFYAEQRTNNAAFTCSSMNPVPTVVASNSSGFEPATYSVGDIDSQDGWKKTGPFDSEVVASPVIAGAQSLRISNAVTNSSFGDQTFAPELSTGAGESTNSPSANHFEAEFKISSTQATEQPGLALSVSPDDGVGSRMSYLRFEDQDDGIHVFFDDVTENAACTPAGCIDFNESDIATLDRSSAHTIKLVMDFVDGPSNDVVKIYIDGVLEATGTSWENYYRFDPEQAGNGNQLFSVDTLIFRAAGVAAPATDGNGFLFDDVTLSSGTL